MTGQMSPLNKKKSPMWFYLKINGNSALLRRCVIPNQLDQLLLWAFWKQLASVSALASAWWISAIISPCTKRLVLV